MQNELGEGALARWPGLIDAALGQVLFASLNVPKRSPVSRAASPEKQLPPASPTAPPASVPSKGLTGVCSRCKNSEIGAADKKMEENSLALGTGGRKLLE